MWLRVADGPRKDIGELCWELLQQEHQRIHHGLTDPTVPVARLMSFLAPATAPLGVFRLWLLRRTEGREDTAPGAPAPATHFLC